MSRSRVPKGTHRTQPEKRVDLPSAQTRSRRHQEAPEFTRAEFESRVERARSLMTEHGLDGVLVTSEANMEYLSGFTSQFPWCSPSRPWYFILPRTGDAVAIIPAIGSANWLATSWSTNILTWVSPNPENEGLDLLVGEIERLQRRFGRFGVEMGAESRLGMPVADLLRIRDAIRPLEMADAMPLLRTLRMVKSEAEVLRIRSICRIVSDAFDRLPVIVHIGDTEKGICRAFAAEVLTRGADKVPYTSIGVGRGGYTSIIMGPTNRRAARGDILCIDAGVKYAGYYCDFNRNIAIGAPPSDEVKRIHDVLWRATERGIAAAVPGKTAADVFKAQAKVVEEAGVILKTPGRFGHGLGKLMTEPPSISPNDHTVLEPGMIITVEPQATYGTDKILVHEENLVVTDEGSKLLTRRASREIPVAGLSRGRS
jgi:Xaa-Pro dipeptidase